MFPRYQRHSIRKATFYKHFADKNELLTYMIQELQRISLKENAIGYEPDEPHSYYIGVFRYLIDFLDGNEVFVLSVLRSSASAVALNLLSEQIERDVRQHLKDEDDETVKTSSDVLASIYAGAVVNCGKWWITQGKRMGKEKIVSQFAEFCMRL